MFKLTICLLIVLCVSSINAEEFATTERDQTDISEMKQKFSNMEKKLDNMEKMMQDTQAQIRAYAEAVKVQSRDIKNMINKQTQGETNDQEEKNMDIVKGRLITLESLLEKMQDDVIGQTESLRHMSTILTTNKDEPSVIHNVQHQIQSLHKGMSGDMTSLLQRLQTQLEAQLVLQRFASLQNLTLDEDIMDAACRSGDVSVVKARLDMGRSTEVTTGFFAWNCLHQAARYNHLDLARLLLDRGANKDATTKGGKTPLMWAAMNGHLKIAQLLVDRGVNRRMRDNDNLSALGYARKGTNQAMISYLISKNVPN